MIGQGWRRLGPRDLPALERFLRARETWCAGFSSRLLAHGTLELPAERAGSVFAEIDPDGELLKAILFQQGGVWFPVLHGALGDSGRAAALAHALERDYAAFSCMGLTDDALALEAALGMRPLDTVDYYDLARDPIPLAVPCPAGASVRLATASDYAELLPIQTAYELEEVLLDPSTFDRHATAAGLKRSLERELVMVALAGDAIVAKAQTNARGLGRDQLGGIFVKPAFRGQGYGRLVVGELVLCLAAEGRGTSLFVKKANAPALSLYRSLGFGSVGDFRIDYFA